MQKSLFRWSVFLGILQSKRLNQCQFLFISKLKGRHIFYKIQALSVSPSEEKNKNTSNLGVFPTRKLMDFGKQSHYNVVLNLGHTGEHTQPATSKKKTPTDGPHGDCPGRERARYGSRGRLHFKLSQFANPEISGKEIINLNSFLCNIGSFACTTSKFFFLLSIYNDKSIIC